MVPASTPFPELLLVLVAKLVSTKAVQGRRRATPVRLDFTVLPVLHLALNVLKVTTPMRLPRPPANHAVWARLLRELPPLCVQHAV